MVTAVESLPLPRLTRCGLSVWTLTALSVSFSSYSSCKLMDNSVNKWFSLYQPIIAVCTPEGYTVKLRISNKMGLFKNFEIYEYSRYRGKKMKKRWLVFTHYFDISVVIEISLFKISKFNCSRIVLSLQIKVHRYSRLLYYAHLLNYCTQNLMK